jgi:hypothetical protein
MREEVTEPESGGLRTNPGLEAIAAESMYRNYINSDFCDVQWFVNDFQPKVPCHNEREK